MKVLDWRNKESWIKEFLVESGCPLNQNLIGILKSRQVKGCWADDLSWLPNDDIFDDFKTYFLSSYTHVRAFHGCRPISVSSYYQYGLVGQNKGLIEAQFKEIFSDVNPDLVSKAIESHAERGLSEKGKIYFTCSDYDLINEFGHYLINGSEYILALAVDMYRKDRSDDYVARLKERGVPTIFEVLIPFDYLPEVQLDSLLKTMIACWGSYFITPEDYYEHGMSFVLHRDLEPIYIANHYHPKKIVDPHGSNVVYKPKVVVCDACQNQL